MARDHQMGVPDGRRSCFCCCRGLFEPLSKSAHLIASALTNAENSSGDFLSNSKPNVVNRFCTTGSSMTPAIASLMRLVMLAGRRLGAETPYQFVATRSG